MLRNKLVGVLIDTLVSRTNQERLGRFLYHRARNEDDDHADRNGEYRLVGSLAKCLKSTPILFDVGANRGDWLFEFKRQFSGSIRGFAFEPANDTHAFLQKRIEASHYKEEITLIKEALSDREGTAVFHIDGALSGSNTLTPRSSMAVVEKIEVAIQSGDQFCEKAKVEQIDFMKIDTEGNEWAVLCGFQRMLSQGRVRALQFEYGGTWLDARILLKDAFQFLQDRGYRMGRIMPKTIEYAGCYKVDYENFCYSNWVAVKKGDEFLLG